MNERLSNNQLVTSKIINTKFFGGRCSVKTVFLKFFQKSQENIFVDRRVNRVGREEEVSLLFFEN